MTVLGLVLDLLFFFLYGIDVTVFGVVLDRLYPRRIDMIVFGAILDFHFCGLQVRLSLLL